MATRETARHLIAALVVTVLISAVAIALCRFSTGDIQSATRHSHQRKPITLDREMEGRIERFCGDCHVLPRPESFSRDRWHFEVQKGFEFYARSGRNDLEVPPPHLALAYFRQRAPAQPTFPKSKQETTGPPVTFRIQRVSLRGQTSILPEIAHLRWTPFGRRSNPILIACDMRYGQVAAIDLIGNASTPTVLARLSNPCHVEPCDLDGDGVIELIVADLGSYRPSDHRRGRVVLLRQSSDGAIEQEVLASDMGRVADVRAGDLDGDGDLDLIVAEFGWYRTGGISLLRNVSAPGGGWDFERQTLDVRPGTIHVPIADFDGDERLDFVALVSQEYESIDLFLNGADSQFRRFQLWNAPDVTFGSSGIDLVDLDQDGDTDILCTNGDAWDYAYATPSHGVHWLENRGRLEFVSHRLHEMPGAYRALPGDLDNDGDQDIVAVAWLPPKLKPTELREARFDSIVILEQTAAARFKKHSVEIGLPFYAALELADFDQDGDLDFVVGSGPQISEARRDKHYLAVWWNQQRSEAADSPSLD